MFFRHIFYTLTLVLFLFTFDSFAAVLTVTDTSDAGPASLRTAINSAASGDTIVFNIPANSPGCVGTNCVIQLTSALSIPPGISVIINGTGPNAITLSGSGTDRVMIMPSGPARDVSLIGLTITNGGLTAGGDGAGVRFESSGNLNITNCTFTNNSITGTGTGRGAALFKSASGGLMTITNSQFVNNTINVTGSGRGAGLYSDSSTNIIDSTFSGNSITVAGSGNVGEGAGIYRSQSGGTFDMQGTTSSGNTITPTGGANTGSGGGLWMGVSGSVQNSTIGENVVHGTGSTGSGIFVPNAGLNATFTSITVTRNRLPDATVSSGGGITTPPWSPQTIRNSIIAGNTRGSSTPDDVLGGYTSQGYNFIGSNNGSTGFTNGVNFDQVGTEASPIDPLLAPLANNGGPTMTYMPISISPVIDRGNAFGLSTDQRGTVRPVDHPTIPNASDGSDIGAVEGVRPTSAAAFISGRVTNAAGRGVVMATITISGGDLPTERSIRTNQLGYYRIDGLKAGETYILTVSGKRSVFDEPSRLVVLYESLTAYDIVSSN